MNMHYINENKILFSVNVAEEDEIVNWKHYKQSKSNSNLLNRYKSVWVYPG